MSILGGHSGGIRGDRGWVNKLPIQLEGWGFEVAVSLAVPRVGMMTYLAAQDTFEGAFTHPSNHVGACAVGAMLACMVLTTADVAYQSAHCLRAVHHHVADCMAASTLLECGGLPREFHHSVRSVHPTTLVFELGNNSAHVVSEYDNDGGSILPSNVGEVTIPMCLAAQLDVR